MTADDTSRDALIEQVENLLMDERDKYPRVRNDAPSADLAEAVVDAVVMPLVQERDQLRAERLPYDFVVSNDGTVHTASRRAIEWQRDAAIKRAEAAEAERDTWHERWRQLMRDYEALFREREAAEAEGDRSWSAK